MLPVISIIIPVYNAATFVTMSVESALRQTYPNMELILINDASSDNTLEVLDAFLKNHPRREMVKIITNNQNRGCGGSRNVGIDHSIGEFLYFMDSDDEITDNCLETLIGPMNRHPFDVVIGSMETFDPETSIRREHIQTHSEVFHESDMKYDNLFITRFLIASCNKLFRKEFLKSIDLIFQPGIFHEDQLFHFYMVFQTKSYAVLPVITYRYYKREDSITGRYTEKNYDDLIFVLQRMTALLEQLKDFPNKLQSAQKYIFMLQFHLAMRVLDDAEFSRHVQKEFFYKFDRVRMSFRNFLDIPKEYWREWVILPQFYFSRPLFLCTFRIFQFIKRLRAL